MGHILIPFGHATQNNRINPINLLLSRTRITTRPKDLNLHGSASKSLISLPLQIGWIYRSLELVHCKPKANLSSGYRAVHTQFQAMILISQKEDPIFACQIGSYPRQSDWRDRL